MNVVIDCCGVKRLFPDQHSNDFAKLGILQDNHGECGELCDEQFSYTSDHCQRARDSQGLIDLVSLCGLIRLHTSFGL